MLLKHITAASEALIAVLPEGPLQRGHDLPHRGLGADALDDARHQVRAAARGVVERSEGGAPLAAARLAERLEARHLFALHALVDDEDGKLRRALVDELVHADHDGALLLQRALRAVS